MSSPVQSLVTWLEFIRLPERPDAGKRYELQDGEVVIVPPARPLHIKLQKRIERLLEGAVGSAAVVTIEFPYRPVPNLQYWFADVAVVGQAEWDAMPPNDYPVYAPPVIVEVLSPSNTPAKVNRQKIIALSAGTQEFWVVNADARTVEVTGPKGMRTYGVSETIPVPLSGGAAITVDAIFS